MFERLRPFFTPPSVSVPTYECRDCGSSFEVEYATCPDCGGDLAEGEGEEIPVYWGEMA